MTDHDHMQRALASTSKAVKDLAEIVTAPQTDDQYDANVIPRDYVMDRVGRISTHLSAIAAALRSAQVPQWQPIETAPRDGTHVLLCSDGGGVWMGHWIGMSGAQKINGWTRYNCVDIGWEPTHWMPLPAAPSAEGLPHA